MMNQDIYSNSKSSIEKEAADRKIPRRFHSKTQEEKTVEIIEAAKTVVAARYPEVTEADITELANITDAAISGESRHYSNDLTFLITLANKAIIENEKLKADLVNFVTPIMERHIALDQITQSLQKPDPTSIAMARLD